MKLFSQLKDFTCIYFYVCLHVSVYVCVSVWGGEYVHERVYYMSVCFMCVCVSTHLHTSECHVEHVESQRTTFWRYISLFQHGSPRD